MKTKIFSLLLTGVFSLSASNLIVRDLSDSGYGDGESVVQSNHDFNKQNASVGKEYKFPSLPVESNSSASGTGINNNFTQNQINCYDKKSSIDFSKLYTDSIYEKISKSRDNLENVEEYLEELFRREGLVLFISDCFYINGKRSTHMKDKNMEYIMCKFGDRFTFPDKEGTSFEDFVNTIMTFEGFNGKYLEIVLKNIPKSQREITDYGKFLGNYLKYFCSNRENSYDFSDILKNVEKLHNILSLLSFKQFKHDIFHETIDKITINDFYLHTSKNRVSSEELEQYRKAISKFISSMMGDFYNFVFIIDFNNLFRNNEIIDVYRALIRKMSPKEAKKYFSELTNKYRIYLRNLFKDRENVYVVDTLSVRDSFSVMNKMYKRGHEYVFEQFVDDELYRIISNAKIDFIKDLDAVIPSDEMFQYIIENAKRYLLEYGIIDKTYDSIAGCIKHVMCGDYIKKMSRVSIFVHEMLKDVDVIRVELFEDILYGTCAYIYGEERKKFFEMLRFLKDKLEKGDCVKDSNKFFDKLAWILNGGESEDDNYYMDVDSFKEIVDLFGDCLSIDDATELPDCVANNNNITNEEKEKLLSYFRGKAKITDQNITLKQTLSINFKNEFNNKKDVKNFFKNFKGSFGIDDSKEFFAFIIEHTSAKISYDNLNHILQYLFDFMKNKNMKIDNVCNFLNECIDKIDSNCPNKDYITSWMFNYFKDRITINDEQGVKDFCKLIKKEDFFKLDYSKKEEILKLADDKLKYINNKRVYIKSENNPSIVMLPRRYFLEEVCSGVKDIRDLDLIAKYFSDLFDIYDFLSFASDVQDTYELPFSKILIDNFKEIDEGTAREFVDSLLNVKQLTLFSVEKIINHYKQWLITMNYKDLLDVCQKMTDRDIEMFSALLDKLSDITKISRKDCQLFIKNLILNTNITWNYVKQIFDIFLKNKKFNIDTKEFSSVYESLRSTSGIGTGYQSRGEILQKCMAYFNVSIPTENNIQPENNLDILNGDCSSVDLVKYVKDYGEKKGYDKSNIISAYNITKVIYDHLNGPNIPDDVKKLFKDAFMKCEDPMTFINACNEYIKNDGHKFLVFLHAIFYGDNDFVNKMDDSDDFSPWTWGTRNKKFRYDDIDSLLQNFAEDTKSERVNKYVKEGLKDCYDKYGLKVFGEEYKYYLGFFLLLKINNN